MFRGKLRTKFLVSLTLVTASLTWATLLVVRHRVQLRVRETISQELKNSVDTFVRMQNQREEMLGRSASLLASLPPLKAVMTSQHAATIQDASADFWTLVGSDLFVLTDRSGNLFALHTTAPGLTTEVAQSMLSRSVAAQQARDWWFGGGHLFEVFLQPIYAGSPDNNSPLGLLALGYEINKEVALDVSHVADSQVAFHYGAELVAATISPTEQTALESQNQRFNLADFGPAEIELDNKEFLATSVGLTPSSSSKVSLTVLKSFDEATEFLESLNRWILGVGTAAALLGMILVFLISTTFTRPLANLVAGVNSLEKGDYGYPLGSTGNDEVSELTAAFRRMRHTLQDAQGKLLESERLATIGRMASTISHDLRHPLTAILANAEFLSKEGLTAEQRKDFSQEIEIAVHRMTNEIGSLLGFSKQNEEVHPTYGNLEPTIHHAIQTVMAMPEHQAITIDYRKDQECQGWFDFNKVERVVLNLLFNACEAVDPGTGQVKVDCSCTPAGIVIRISDNGPGIPEEIRDKLFQPFVSFGKAKGIGLGLAVVQKIMQDHGGEVTLESTGPAGTSFLLCFRAQSPAPKLASA